MDIPESALIDKKSIAAYWQIKIKKYMEMDS